MPIDSTYGQVAIDSHSIAQIIWLTTGVTCVTLALIIRNYKRIWKYSVILTVDGCAGKIVGTDPLLSFSRLANPA